MKSTIAIVPSFVAPLVWRELSKAQRDLINKHGTPKEFALAVWSMVGEISVDEAQAAIRKYNIEFSKL